MVSVFGNVISVFPGANDKYVW